MNLSPTSEYVSLRPIINANSYLWRVSPKLPNFSQALASRLSCALSRDTPLRYVFLAARSH
jgi:hypothetical protein